ncbi:hypothetical protein [Streptomyces sp. NPDC093097]|uniref:hypothetical protein n=1 Tax=Streptomyces sp. NPDC093097 TaxID=3366027 RepID=UPI00382D897C
MDSCLQGDLPASRKRVLMLGQSITGAHAVGHIPLQPAVVSNAEITQPVCAVLDPRHQGIHVAAVFLLRGGVLERHDRPLDLAKFNRCALEGMAGVLGVQRTVLETHAEVLCAGSEGVSGIAVPVLHDIRNGLVEQGLHAAVRRVAGQLVVDVHPVTGDPLDLGRLSILDHVLQALQRVA